MSTGTFERINLRAVTLSCGCQPLFRNCPPVKGDYLTCLTHGSVTVVKTERINASTQERGNSDEV